MGFSVTIASAITLVGLLVAFTSVSVGIFQGLRELSNIANEYLSHEREKLDVRLDLTVESVTSTSCNITVKNTGCRTVFLKGQNGFQWNTILFSYGNSSEWRSYSIEQYQVLEIEVSNTSYSFNVDSHSFVNPGEEALISFSIPNGAPEIPVEGLVSVAFATHYGVTARDEGVR